MAKVLELANHDAYRRFIGVVAEGRKVINNLQRVATLFLTKTTWAVLLAFATGINWTLGLPFIRTSPDHGTACDIAGKGVADADSMLAALRLAKQLARTRA